MYSPSNDLQTIINEIYSHIESTPQRLFARAGVIFSELIETNVYLPSLFEEKYEQVKLLDLPFKMYSTKREFLSQEFTTDWNNILEIN